MITIIEVRPSKNNASFTVVKFKNTKALTVAEDKALLEEALLDAEAEEDFIAAADIRTKLKFFGNDVVKSTCTKAYPNEDAKHFSVGQTSNRLSVVSKAYVEPQYEGHLPFEIDGKYYQADLITV